MSNEQICECGDIQEIVDAALADIVSKLNSKNPHKYCLIYMLYYASMYVHLIANIYSLTRSMHGVDYNMVNRELELISEHAKVLLLENRDYIIQQINTTLKEATQEVTLQ